MSTKKIKTLTIKRENQSLVTGNFKLLVDNLDYGIFKKDNRIKTSTINDAIHLTIEMLTKITYIIINMENDEEITLRWHRLRGRFEAVEEEHVISQTSKLTFFSKIFYLVLFAIFVLSAFVLIFVYL